MKDYTCKRCNTVFSSMDWHRCPPQIECITCKTEFFSYKDRSRCDDCEEILSKFIMGQKV